MVKGIFALVVLAGIAATAVQAGLAMSDTTPRTGRTVDVPAYTQPVMADGPALNDRTIVLDTVYIVAKHAAKPARQTSQCGAFQFRPVTQGPVDGSVRGFCL